MWKWAVVVLCTAVLAPAGMCTDSETALREARVLAKAGDLRQAIEVCNTILSDCPAGSMEPRARLFMGNLLTKAGSPPEDSMAQFARIADGFPNSPEAPEALLRIGYLRDRLKQPPSEWEQVAARYPETAEAAEALHCLGHQALKANDLRLALKRFKQSADTPQVTPSRAADSQVEAGYACISLYWKTHDRNALRDALTLFPQFAGENSTEHMLRGSVHDIRSRLGRGEVYLLQGNGGRAALEYQAVLDMHPTDPYLLAVAQFELGCSLYAKRDWQGAISAFDSFLQNRQGETLVLKNAAWKQNRPGYSKYVDTDPARAAHLSGLDMVPDAAYWKAASMVKLKQFAQAKQILDVLGGSFQDAKIAPRVQETAQFCDYMLGETAR